MKNKNFRVIEKYVNDFSKPKNIMFSQLMHSDIALLSPYLSLIPLLPLLPSPPCSSPPR